MNRYLNLAFSYLSRTQRFMLVSLIIITLVIVFWQHNIYTIISEQYNHHRIIPSETQCLREKIIANKSLNQEFSKNKKDNYIISNGDTLSGILVRYGINITDIMILAKQYPILCHMKTGQSISWQLMNNNHLKRLTWKISNHETRVYSCIKQDFKESIFKITETNPYNFLLKKQINNKFIKNDHIASLTNNNIQTIIKILQWQLDLHNLRKEDKLIILTNREMLNGKIIKNQVLAIRLCTNNKDYYAFRARNGKFYNLHAISLTNNFIRFPINKKYRISSDFNPRRVNPVTGRIAPHLGVDFAVSVGTPVLAIGDGEIIVSKRDKIAGNYITIRHNNQYITKYMHLKKLLVKQGQKVKCGELIALSGNTGRTTGPHLHFEIWINKQAVNPLTVNLPYSESLTGRDRDEYFIHMKKMMLQLQ